MDKVRSLVNTNELKSDYLANLDYKINPIFHYDDLSDTFMFLFLPPDEETVVHPLDRHVALLYTPKDKEIVGFQIEDFESEFILMYNDLKNAWCLSDFDFEKTNKNNWDLVLEAQKRNLKVALSILKMKEKLIGAAVKDFERVLE